MENPTVGSGGGGNRSRRERTDADVEGSQAFENTSEQLNNGSGASADGSEERSNVAKRSYRAPSVVSKGLVATMDELRAAVARVRWIPEPMSGCWLWYGAVAHKGYGQVWLPGSKRRVMAHRALYQVERNVLVPPDLEMDHRCRNPACVNPDHLEPVTSRENALRGTSLWAENARKKTCKRGHPYEDNNSVTAKEPQHWRRCRICHLAKTRESYQRAKARRGLFETRDSDVAGGEVASCP